MGHDTLYQHNDDNIIISNDIMTNDIIGQILCFFGGTCSSQQSQVIMMSFLIED